MYLWIIRLKCLVLFSSFFSRQTGLDFKVDLVKVSFTFLLWRIGNWRQARFRFMTRCTYISTRSGWYVQQNTVTLRKNKPKQEYVCDVIYINPGRWKGIITNNKEDGSCQILLLTYYSRIGLLTFYYRETSFFLVRVRPYGTFMPVCLSRQNSTHVHLKGTHEASMGQMHWRRKQGDGRHCPPAPEINQNYILPILISSTMLMSAPTSSATAKSEDEQNWPKKRKYSTEIFYENRLSEYFWRWQILVGSSDKNVEANSDRPWLGPNKH